MSPDERVRVCMTIAGSDSGGGAGIQADLKAFARCGVHGTCAITAITAQNTVGVELVTQVPGPTVVAQVHAVAEDIGVDAVKVGMLGDEATIDAVVEALALVGEAPVVVDPVMVSASGATLLDRDAKAALIERILPLATVATPNLPEARELAGLGEGASAEELARAIQALGPEAVVVTGGHSDDGADVLFDGIGTLRIDGPRYADGAPHGRAAPTRRRSRPSSPVARRSPRPRAGPARSPRRRWGNGLADRRGIGLGARGRWTPLA